MIELKNDSLVFSFSDVHPEAKLSIDFQRTLRIPDDGDDYPLPPGLGQFPLKHVDDFAENLPSSWIEHGGIMFPMYQSEALWLNFSSEYLDENATEYPFAVKIATGKINAITGKEWSNSLNEDPQDYLVVPEQPWLDGYCVEKGIIRQFIAMPLGSGYSAEEQITGKGECGGLQIIAYPMKRKVFEKRFKKEVRSEVHEDLCYMSAPESAIADMGLAPGGKMRQEIYDDPFDFNDWDTENASRCFVHITNSLVWRAITEKNPPSVPLTASEYNNHGLPWFEYYDDSPALDGSDVLKKIKSVIQLGKEKGDNPLPENESVKPEQVVNLKSKLKKHQVREGSF
ncbi:MAG: hypothetical protein HOC09_22330 [Deltaproteobacteria bacterium]|jgi:hypothetical protein|nr:hypothetical protein [Deltaproteobacteria bacterium]